MSHTLSPAGECVETCPDESHAGPVNVMVADWMKPLFDEWLSNLDLEAKYFPTPPGHDEGIRQYVVIVAPGHPLMKASPLEGRLRAGAPPRPGRGS